MRNSIFAIRALIKSLKRMNVREKTLTYFFLFLILGLSINTLFWLAPQEMSNEDLFRIEEGDSLSQISKNLEKKKLVESGSWFRLFVMMMGGERKIKAGDYYIEKPLPVFTLAYRTVVGKFSLTPLKITVPEGLNTKQVAELLKPRLKFLNEEEFVRIADEGRLFPDTYFFLPNAGAREVIRTMEGNFDKKMEEIKDKISESGENLNEILIMASIIEEEALNQEDRKIVSGILWKRLEIEMPLQVDATFSYVNGKNTYELTHDDLRIESPYNSYRNVGLPPTPISNPGLDAILAALEPTETNYFYFLADRRGNTYYAETFEEHQTNREKYLRR